MAKKKKKAGRLGAPAWMATFGDLMNLLLCFFVLLFSMSTVDAEKFEMVIASLQSSFSILPAGGGSVGDGVLISAGVSQLTMFDDEYMTLISTLGQDGSATEDLDLKEEYQAEALNESEDMADNIQEEIKSAQIDDQAEVDFTSQYVLITLNGALLFGSGSADIREEAIPLVDKIGTILEGYSDRIIEIEGHTDNMPINTEQYASNDELSCFRALAVTNYLREHKDLDPEKIKFAGRGEYVPIADNSTAEGRARNRRVEIKIYNSYNSY